MRPKPQTKATGKQIIGQLTHGHKNVTIAAINIEGVKSNIPFLIEQSRHHKLFCISEHWLWDFEKTAIDNMITKL